MIPNMNFGSTSNIFRRHDRPQGLSGDAFDTALLQVVTHGHVLAITCLQMLQCCISFCSVLHAQW